MSFIFRTASVLNVTLTLKMLKYSRPTFNCFATATFGVSHTVKLDSYISRRQNATDKLKDTYTALRLNIINSLDTMDLINARDIQELVFTAKEDDVDLVIAALKKLELQPDRLRFTNFNMDAIVMRMFAYLKLPEKACEVFLDEDLRKLFLGYNTVVILLDLLYKNGLYQNILDCVDTLEKRQNFSVWPARSVNAFYMISCLKMNTPEALKKGWLYFEKIKKYREPGHEIISIAGLIAVRTYPDKVEHVLKQLDKFPLYPDINSNITLQYLIKVGKLSDVEHYLEHVVVLKKQSLTKDTHDLIIALPKNESDCDKFDKIFKKCKILDVDSTDYLTQLCNDQLEGRHSKMVWKGRRREDPMS